MKYKKYLCISVLAVSLLSGRNVSHALPPEKTVTAPADAAVAQPEPPAFINDDRSRLRFISEVFLSPLGDMDGPLTFHNETMKLGTKVNQETFTTLKGKEAVISYTGRPTVLLFWGNMGVGAVAQELHVLQKTFMDMPNKANFYTVNFDPYQSPDQIINTLVYYGCILPALIDKQNVWRNYVRVSPSLIIMDKNGVVRYRPNPDITAPALEKLIVSSNTPYVAVPAPKTAKQWLERGDQIYRDKNSCYSEALDAYTQAIRLQPDYADAYCRRAFTAYKNRDDYTALQDANKLIELKPHELLFHYLRARIYTNQYNYKAALAEYNNILALKPDEYTASLGCAHIYALSSDYAAAADAFSKLLVHAPKDQLSALYVKRGLCYQSLHQNEAAIADYSKALSPGASSVTVFNASLIRGALLLQQNDYDHAIADFTRAIAIQPVDDAYEWRACAYWRQGKIDAAIADMTKIINVDPGYAYVYYTRGLLFVRKQQYPQAIADFTLEKARNPHMGAFPFALAQVLELKGEKERALENYQEALKAFSSFDHSDSLRKAQERINGDWNSDTQWIDFQSSSQSL